MSAQIQMRRWFVSAVLVTLFCAQAATTSARAGTYELRACIYATPLHFDARLERYLNGRVDVAMNCDREARGRVGIYQTRKGTPFAASEGAGYRWHAPSGATFVASQVWGKLRNANGIAAQIYATNPHDGYYSLDANLPHDGVERLMKTDFPSTPRSQVAIRLACLTKPPCSNRASDVKAFFEVREISLKLRDDHAPTVEAGGALFKQSTNVYRGRVAFSYSASDKGGGLWRARAEINNSSLDLGAFGCAGDRNGFTDRTQPCPTNAARNGSFDTTGSPFVEGSNRVRICVDDYATDGKSHRGCTAWRTITVDNSPPAAPKSLTVAEGSGWRAENGFDVSWTNPAPGTTPITAAQYWIEDATTGALVESAREVSATNRALPRLWLPRPGHFKVHVQLRDGAGNLGPPASTSLRFDDQPPGEPDSDAPSAWLGSGDFPLRLTLTEPRKLGPSRLAGYAVRIGGDKTLHPCRNRICQADEVNVGNGAGQRQLDIEARASGEYWLSAVAVSGAGVPSKEVHHARLRVDRTDPKTELRGAPASWSRDPVTLTVHAQDSESGMEPLFPFGLSLPKTVIEVSGQPLHQEIGARASVTIVRQGVHRVRYWARDLAGNSNDGSRLSNGYRHDPAGSTLVRIDQQPPDLAFLPMDSERPELIRVKASDALSGVSSGSITYREVGSSAPPTELETRMTGNVLVAHFPSDTLAEGDYELAAHAVDRAGNSSAVKGEGPRMLLTVPLKAASSMTLRMLTKERSRRPFKHGGRARVEGVLRDHSGNPVPGVEVELVERFASGSRVSERTTAHVTNASGRFRQRLEAGPSREVFARYPGGRVLARSDSAAIRFATPAAISLQLKPTIARNGEKVRMRGRVRGRGARIPAQGKLVAIQYLDRSRRRWRPVELVRTNRRGVFRFGYSFSTVTSPQRFVFRAVAVPEAGWPYLRAQTRGQDVVVYPQ